MTLYSASPFQAVCIFDPAIDPESDVMEYAETRDMTKLKLLPGKSPTIFHVRRIAQSKVLSMMQQSAAKQALHGLAFMHSVVRVENLQTEDGQCVDWRPECVTPGSKLDMLKVDELDLFAADEIQEIGAVAYERAFLRRGREACYVPPESSALALGKKARCYHRAEPTSLRSEKPSVGAQDSASTTEQSGDELGSVIVTGKTTEPNIVTLLSTVTEV